VAAAGKLPSNIHLNFTYTTPILQLKHLLVLCMGPLPCKVEMERELHGSEQGYRRIV
jgi:hypothetical protein